MTKHVFGRVRERNGERTEMETGTRNFHLINNGSMLLCTKIRAIGRSWSLQSGWAVWRRVVCPVEYYPSHILHMIPDYVRLADSDSTDVVPLVLRNFVSPIIVCFDEKNRIFGVT